MKFKYSDTYVVGSGSIQNHTRIYRGNGPWDPLEATGGDQPPGWDEWILLYNRYKCFGSKIVVTFMNTAVDIPPIQVAVLAQRNQALPTSTTSAIGAFNSANMWNSRYATLQAANFSKTQATLKLYRSTKQMFKGDYDPLGSTSDTSGLPSQQWYWMLAINSMDPNGTDPLSVTVRLTITYYCMMYDRRAQAQLND